MINIIIILLAILIILSLVGYSKIETLLGKVNNRIDNLSEDFEVLENTLEENKPEELYKVELKHYEGDEIVTTSITGVIKVEAEVNSVGWTYYKGDSLIFTKKDGVYSVKEDNVIEYNMSLM
jgi:hypothetical protein